jgi:PleD family two-component response regulator
VAVYQAGDTAVTILNRADKGVYKAKAEGKNRVCHIEPKLIKKTI